MIVSEQWLPIANTDGLYEVSNLGRVRSFCGRGRGPRAKTPRLISLIDINGYQYAGVKKEKDTYHKHYPVHHLVLEAFVTTRPSPMHEVNHKDFDKRNNRVENLEWVTRKQNMQHHTDNRGNPMTWQHVKEKHTAIVSSDAYRMNMSRKMRGRPKSQHMKDALSTSWINRRKLYVKDGRMVGITHEGVTRSLKEWSALLGIPVSTIYDRYKQGRTTADILSTKRLPHRTHKTGDKSVSS